MAALPAHTRAVADDLLADAEHAEAKAEQRQAWAATCDRQAASYRAEAEYLRAYAAEKRRLVETARWTS